jgi:hypothetical protein
MNISILNPGINNCLKPKEDNKTALDHSGDTEERKFGTVGAVAL